VLLRDDGAGVETRLADCAGAPVPRECFERAYAGAAQQGEVAATLAALESLDRRGVIEDCHLEAHRLARAVHGVVADVERTFLLGGPQCRLGYLHGAVEASGSVAHGVEPPRCDRLGVSLQRRACAHGYGHALMLANAHEIDASLRGCDEAGADGIEYPSCEAGVLMEASLRFARTGRSVVGAAPACAALGEERVRRLCYENVGVVAALALDHDRSRAAAVCSRLAPGAPRAGCLAGADGEIAEARRGSGGRG
jgi:hypothetical protein